MNPEQIKQQSPKVRLPHQRELEQNWTSDMERAHRIKLQDNYKQQPKRCKCNTAPRVGQDAVYMHDIVYLQCYLQGFPPTYKAKIIFFKTKLFQAKRFPEISVMPRLSWEFTLDLNIDCLEVPSDSKRPKHWTLPFPKYFLKICHVHSYSECPDGSAQIKLNILLEKKKSCVFPSLLVNFKQKMLSVLLFIHLIPLHSWGKQIILKGHI